MLKKVVLKLDLHDDKDKQKVMKAVSKIPGVDSMSIDMKDMKLTVIGDIDPVAVVIKLRKCWMTDLLYVEPAKEPGKKEEKKEYKKEDPVEIRSVMNFRPAVQTVQTDLLYVHHLPTLAIAGLEGVGKTETRISHPWIESQVYGRNKERKEVVDFLLGDRTDHVLSVLAITGLEGVGKTTLTRLVFNDDKVRQEFEVHIWVSLSELYSTADDIIRAIIECATGDKHDHHLTQVESMAHLQKTLDGKRFLLVLDDASTLPVVSELLSFLSRGKKGSKAIVTTASDHVALGMDDVLCFRLFHLSQDHCWTLFRERAFGSEGREDETPYLVQIGMDIVNMCAGVPLAVKAMGSLMGSKRGEAEWLLIRNHRYTDPSIFSLLEMSYHHLPSSLKLCFAYCSLFPLGFVFLKDKLVASWVAEGFVVQSSSDDGTDLEDIGGRYFDALLNRSFFHDEISDDSGNVVSCKMHRLFHNLACSIAWPLFNRRLTDEARHRVLIPPGCQHLSVTGGTEDFSLMTSARETMILRSLLLSRPIHRLGNDIASDIDMLWLLDLSNTMLEVLPEWIGDLQQLKLLDLSGTDVEVLPDSVTNLCNLQTLNISNCLRLHELPLTIGGLENLRFLDLSYSSIQELPESLISLCNLQRLYLRNCSKLLELPCAIGRLENLRVLDLAHCRIQALPQSIAGLRNLQTLNLANCSEIRELPEGVQNMSNLTHLDISGVELFCMPHGLGKLQRLRKLPLFVVSNEQGRTIVELQCLNDIRATLKITGLCNVEDPAEAMEANVAAKAGLHSLELWWRTRWTRQWGEVAIDWASSSPPSRTNKDVDILEKLQPHRNLRHLTIEDYSGDRFPSWLASMNHSSTLPNLESFSLYNLENCKILPPLGRLPSLKCLKLESTYVLKRIDNLGGMFSSLQYFMLWNLPALEVWSLPNKEMFPSLTKLSIIGCPRLRIHPCLPSTLLDLELESVSEDILVEGGCLYGLSRLRKLKIAHFEVSKSGWKGLQYLTALEELEINNCHLTCLPDSIIEMKSASLWVLKLTLNNYLETLEDGGGEPPLFFSALRCLVIEGCDELTALPEWVEGLTFLHSLEISYCENLAMLPKKLPAGLTQLKICGCPLLERRWQRDIGQDWPMIAHVPEIKIVSTE